MWNRRIKRGPAAAVAVPTGMRGIAAPQLLITPRRCDEDAVYSIEASIDSHFAAGCACVTVRGRDPCAGT